MSDSERPTDGIERARRALVNHMTWRGAVGASAELAIDAYRTAW